MQMLDWIKEIISSTIWDTIAAIIESFLNFVFKSISLVVIQPTEPSKYLTNFNQYLKGVQFFAGGLLVIFVILAVFRQLSGGGMHIADFGLGHLGANAIVGGHMAIATGAAISCRYKQNEKLVLCLAGDGAYSNGIAHESMNIAAMAQFKNGLMETKFGVPIIFGIVNNGYAMSGQEIGEITGLDYLARRGAGYNLDSMHAEVVDGMNVAAVLDATSRAACTIKKGEGPVLLEFITYRYKGHSLSDPLSYRDRSELELWQEKDPIKIFSDKLIKTDFPEEQGGKITKGDIDKLKEGIYNRNAQMAKLAAGSLPPAKDSLLSFVFSEKKLTEIPKSFSSPKTLKSIPFYKRDDRAQTNTRLAIREAIIEEMTRDGRVILFGEDIADYGGAFG
ncbi:MAG: thiamine pyrophosphate-dependent enzyme, partial [Actinobacteria bacterium]|nr:thiamine pyrophosphate-dependent enzyme [Actinomycetota bacterium]